MKKYIILVALICFSALSVAQNCLVKQSDYSKIRLQFSTPQPTVTQTSILKHEFCALTLTGFYSQTAAGLPALPSLVKIIEVPLGDGLYFNIESIECDTIDAAILGIDEAIVPAQPSRSKSDISPATLVMDKAAYGRNEFCGAPLIELNSLGVARNRNLASVSYSPIRWNPATNQLIVVKSLSITIQQRNADIAATKRMQQLYASPAFNSSSNVINSLGSKDNHTNAPLRYTIVAHSSFRGALDDFAAWKTRKGFLVDLVYTDDTNVGSSTSSIKNYLQGLYDNATATSPAPTYVLFVGDIAQVPAFILTSAPYSTETQHSDLSYCCWTGNDNLPDCYYGRFSAQNLSQLEPQISKTLMYEQYTFPDPSYLGTAALIAGVDGGYSGDNAYNYGDPAMDYVAKTYITTANGFNNIVYYKNNTSFAPAGVTVTGSSQASGTSAALRDLYNNGCGFVNYTAHGSTTSWGDPSFTNNNVAQMSNNDKPMVMIGNCCLTNSFQIDACFGETLLRKGNNAGAVGYIGGSNSTYWTEDFYWTVGIRSNINNTMNANYDANNLGMYDRLYHSHNETYDKWYLSMGAMIQAGNMAVQASTTGNGMKEYYWQIYHVMGDPSLMPYIHGVPFPITANVPAAANVGSTSLTINTIPYAYIGFTDENNNLIGAAFADANGVATLSFQALSNPGEYQIVITAQGYQPRIQTINVIANGPYVNALEMTPTATLSANGDISFDVKLQNMGVSDAANISIEFQNLDGSILLDTTGIIDLGTGLASGETLFLHNVGTGHIWGQTPDQTQATYKVIVRWGNTINDMSTSSFQFVVNADNLKMQNFSIDSTTLRTDGNATITVKNRNIGHSDLNSASISLLSLDPAFEVSSPSTNVSNISVGDSCQLTYNIVANGAIPDGRTVIFLQTINNGFRANTDTITINFGDHNELITFEDNSYTELDWDNGTYPWTIETQDSYSGSRCLRSFEWASSQGGNKKSELSITWTSTVNDSITFYKKASSEENYDYFRFFIDGTLKEEMSGTSNNWSRSAYYVPKGTHTFKFSYEKDYSVNRGSDCAWIDDLHLPLSGSIYAYILDSTCQGNEYQFRDTLISTECFEPGVYHYSDSADNVTYYLTLVLTSTPEVTITGGDVTIRKGETVRLYASGADKYVWESGETSAIIDVYPTETTTYTVTGYNGNCFATASTTITVDGTIGIENIETESSDIVLYPNPASDILHIEFLPGRIELTDITGRTILQQEAAGTSTNIDISNLGNGIYFILATDNNGNKKTAKFIKN